jgi:glyoxalase family protein
MKLEGIHHITAITGDARRNLDFYTRVLGLRLAAKTVNQDDPSAYHLFYADEQGRPGSELTFFEYAGAPQGTAGAGMVHRIVWRVRDDASVDFWAERLANEGVPVERTDTGLLFTDFESLAHELTTVDNGNEPLTAEHPEIPQEHALLGFAAVRAYTDDPDRSRALLEKVLGASPAGDGAWELRGERRGSVMAYDAPPENRPRPGAGTVHHIAWGTTIEEHPRWEDHLESSGVRTSGIIDRHYFHSIYFREPSGVLFEIADDGPGFTVDVPLEELGSKTILPPKLEPYREQIEANLTPLPDPRADRAAAARQS